MKVCFDYQVFTLQTYGGASRYFFKLAEGLHKLNFDVNLYTGLYRNKYIKTLPKNIVKGVEVEDYPYRTGILFRLLNHAYCQTKIKFSNANIIHETYYTSYPVCKTKALRVVTVLDMIHEIYGHEIPGSNKTTHRKFASVKRADHIISISHSTKRDLINIFNIPESKISVVHLGVDEKQINDESSFHGRVNSIGDFILYVGNRDGYKNFNNFLKACASSSKIKNKIKIVAFGGGFFSNSEKTIIHDLGFEDEYVIHKSGDDLFLNALYRKAICLVYPSLYEGFGLPPLEAMAVGCPVVSSNTSSMPEVINNAGEYFDPTNIGSIEHSIEKVVYDEELRNRLIKSGNENIKLFSWEKCVQETANIYHNLRK